jgi:hypothetical protein
VHSEVTQFSLQLHALAPDIPFADPEEQPALSQPHGDSMCMLTDEGFSALMACPALAAYATRFDAQMLICLLKE